MLVKPKSHHLFESKFLSFIRNATLGWAVVIVLTALTACGGGGGGGGSSAPGTLQLMETSFDAIEGTMLNVIVARSGGGSGVASVDFHTADGTALGGTDYASVSGTLTWPNGVSGNRTISIPITDDNTAEPSESFTLTLSNVSGATLGTNSSGNVDIIDNDVAAVSAFGSITALNSATVNGIHYDTNVTTVSINGRSATVSDLKLGQVVEV